MNDDIRDDAAALPAMQGEQMTEEDFEALEEILTSDVVPEDCMDLEMLDGYLAGVLISPRAIPPERWLPGVWSAHGDEADFGSGSALQRAIRLVKAYHNELLSTLGLDDEDEACWEPFCFAVAEGDGLKLGEAWIDGFAQGLDLWPRAGKKGWMRTPSRRYARRWTRCSPLGARRARRRPTTTPAWAGSQR